MTAAAPNAHPPGNTVAAAAAAVAGDTARLMKMLMRRAGLQNIFLDSDNLFDLDTLLQTVKSCETITLLAT